MIREGKRHRLVRQADLVVRYLDSALAWRGRLQRVRAVQALGALGVATSALLIWLHSGATTNEEATTGPSTPVERPAPAGRRSPLGRAPHPLFIFGTAGHRTVEQLKGILLSMPTSGSESSPSSTKDLLTALIEDLPMHEMAGDASIEPDVILVVLLAIEAENDPSRLDFISTLAIAESAPPYLEKVLARVKESLAGGTH